MAWQPDVFCPAHNGEKSIEPFASAAARKGVIAVVANGNKGTWRLMAPISRMMRLTMLRAGRPVNRLVRQVCVAISLRELNYERQFSKRFALNA